MQQTVPQIEPERNPSTCQTVAVTASVHQMVAVHSYRPHWPDELELSPGDVILVLSKHEEERWFGRLQGGQRGYFPASCVMELSQVGPVPK